MKKVDGKIVAKVYDEIKRRMGRCTMVNLSKTLFEMGYANPYTHEPYTPVNLRYHLRRQLYNLKSGVPPVILVEDDNWKRTTNWMRNKIGDYVPVPIQYITPDLVWNMQVAGMSIPAHLLINAKKVWVVTNNRKVIEKDEDLDETEARLVPFIFRFDYR